MDTGAPPPPSNFETFEMIHMNRVADKHASQRILNVKERAKAAQFGWRTFEEFPAGATELKSIWRRIPKGGCISLGVWDDLGGNPKPGIYHESD